MTKKQSTQLVQIYERKTKGGITFYLHYTLNGEQVRENTRLKLSGNKEADKVILKAVQMLQADRTAEILSGRTGIAQTTQRNNILLLDYCKKIKEKYAKSNNNTDKGIYSSMLKLEKVIEDVAPKVKLCNVDKKVCETIRNYIQNLPLKAGTQAIYYGRFVWLMKQAVQSELINNAPTNKIEGIKADTPEKVYLLENEIKAFSKVETSTKTQQETKDAFLFCCFTGLRYSDMSRLTSEHVEAIDGGKMRLKIETKKTKKYISFLLPNECIEIIKDRVTKGGLLFDCPTLPFINILLKEFAQKSGINKTISFHTARHTFATLLLTKGADLYSVSSLLGHSNISTTQVYAKIIDKKKDDTIKLLEGVL